MPPFTPFSTLLLPILYQSFQRSHPRIFQHNPLPITTACQELILNRFKQKKDLLTCAGTGTGKSLALVLGLVDEHLRARAVGGKKAPCSLLLVPYYSLASQLYGWMSEIVQQVEGLSECKIPIQLLGEQRVVGNNAGKALPGLCVATPTGLLAGLPDDKLQRYARELDTVVLDEVDALLRLPGRYALPNLDLYGNVRPGGNSRAGRQWAKHPPPGYLVLSSLLQANTSEGSEGRRKQVIATSATVNSVLRSLLMHRTGWMDKEAFVNLDRVENVPKGLMGQVEHTAIVVGEGRVRNVMSRSELAKVGDQKRSALQPRGHGDFEEELASALATSIGFEREEYGSSMGDILVCAHPRMSLSLLGSRLAGEHGLDTESLKEDQSGQQHGAKVSGLLGRIYLATEAQARGLDLPSLSHVYILSTPSAQCPSNDVAYEHMSGRLCRLGSISQLSGGRVIQLIAASPTPSAPSGDLRLHQLWNRLDLHPVAYKHVQ